MRHPCTHRGDSASRPDPGNVQDAIVEGQAMFLLFVLPQALAVVSHHDDQRLLLMLFGLKMLHQSLNLQVDVRDSPSYGESTKRSPKSSVCARYGAWASYKCTQQKKGFVR